MSVFETADVEGTDSGRACARCDSDARKGSRFCAACSPHDADTADDEQGDYVREDGHSGPRWTHEVTGLRVELVRQRRPASRTMTRRSAMQPDDEIWTFAVRPDGSGSQAAIYEDLGGDKQGAVAYAQEWMDDHPDGRLEEDT